jgi:hypothetical protein
MVPSTSTITSGKEAVNHPISTAISMSACCSAASGSPARRGTRLGLARRLVMGWDDGRVARRPALALALSGIDAVATLSEVAEWTTGITRLHPSS